MTTNKAIVLLVALGFLALGAFAVYSSLQLGQTQRQLAATQAQSAAQSAKLNDTVAQLQTQIAALQPAAEKARQLPIECAFRRALLGGGLVLELKNISTEILPVTISATSTTFNQTKTFNAVIDNGRILQIGPARLLLAPGDQIVVRSNGYDDAHVVVPQ